METKTRFWNKVKVKDAASCWLWTATTTEKGYGRFFCDGKLRAAHRVAQMCVGEIPAGMEVCYTCDVPGCVNPNHLFVGSHKQNQEDKARKGAVRCNGR